MRKLSACLMLTCLLPLSAAAQKQAKTDPVGGYCSLPANAVARQLGWVSSNENYCGGYYLEQPFIYPVQAEKKETVEITSDASLYSQRGTTTLEGNVTVNRFGQQITSNKAFVYRNKTTGKLNSLEMIGNVHLREPNTLIVATKGRYFFDTKSKTLADILYRTSLMNGRQVAGPHIPDSEVEKERKVRALTAWGKANEFSQLTSDTYELYQSTYTTCPPDKTPAWQVRAGHIFLDKISGRGYATHARILVKGVPVFYTPYINFPIDHRRKTGFLWPTLGLMSNDFGPYVRLPFYLNLAPNYDLTITPAILSKRGILFTNDFRYLSTISRGKINFTFIPHDRFFAEFQQSAASNAAFTNSNSAATQANLRRLLDANTFRKGFFWRDKTHFNKNWSTQVDFNYAGDDYYMQDFGNLNQLTENQLLEEGVVDYHGLHWNFTTRVQGYQTLHPLNQQGQIFENQYRRLPQLILNTEYPDQAFGLNYFIKNEATHFDILKTPGGTLKPIGNRFYTQPGISLPYSLPYFNFSPRAQLALREYSLYQTTVTNTPTLIRNGIPIFDVATGLAVTRDGSFLNYQFQQTLEPQIYYVYIPYRDQSEIPVFDTTTNTLTYDQLFNYNRFSGIDRIGDANQLSLGLTSRIIDRESGFEKIRLSVGEIVYFANRIVTLCTGSTCSSAPITHENKQRLSPISAFFDYHLNPLWSFRVDPFIWNPVSKQITSSTVALHYQPDNRRIVNLGYSYAFSGDGSGLIGNNTNNNLKVTDFSFAWPATSNVSVVGRWTQNWNLIRLQNLLYGLQYDTCCWTVRMVGGRAYRGVTAGKQANPQYNNEFYIQFSLKGLGDIGSGDPSALLSTITGYNTHFGQE